MKTLTNYNSNPIVNLEKIFDNLFNTTPLFHSLDEIYRTGDQVRFATTSDNLVVQVDLPGVDKQDLDLSTDNNIREVYIKATRKIRTNEGVRDQTYNRSFSVGREFELDKIMFEYKNGLLEVIVPRLKRGEAIKTYKIE